jgi:hypothetical protein
MSTVSTSARVTFDDAMRLPGIIPRRSKQDSLQEIVAEFVNTNVYRIDGQSILFREFRERLAAWAIRRELIVTHSPREIASAVEALGFPYGVRHSNQRHIGNASWTNDTPDVPLVAIEGRLFRITKRPTKPKPGARKRSVRNIVNTMKLLGYSDRDIVKRLNARGFVQQSGKPHTTKSIREACR